MTSFLLEAMLPRYFEWIVLAIAALWVATIIEIAISTFSTKSDKLMWILIVALLGVIGCIIYFIVGRKNRIKKPNDLDQGS